MRIASGPSSLSRRIAGTAAIGLAAILLLLGLVTLWTIHEATDSAYHDRVMLSAALASRVDDVLRYSLAALEEEAPGLDIRPGVAVSEVQIRRLSALRARVGAFATISVVDAAGHLLWVTPMGSASTLGDPLSHAGLSDALRGAGPQIAEFASPQAGGKPFACVSVPVRDASGQISGALMAEIDPAYPALGILPAGEMGDGIYAQLISANGRVLAGTRGYSLESGREHSVLLADLIASHTAGYRLHDDATEVPFSTHVVAYAPLSVLPSWGVTIEQSNDAALSLPRQLEQRMMLFGLAAILFAASIAWVAARTAVQPIKQLTTAAERFAAGKLDEPVHLDRADEIGTLARAFDTMRLQLRASLAEVAEWNRTALLDPDRVVALVLRKARELAGADLAGLALAEDGSADLVWWTLDGQGSRRRRIRPGDEAAVEEVMRTGLPRRSTGPGPGDPREVLAVPLFGGGQTFGVLVVGNHDTSGLGEDEAALVSSLANQSAVALENARLYRRIQSMAVLEERERIAREMHDGLAQVLGFVNTKAIAVARLLEVGRPESARTQLSELESMVRSLYADVREAIIGLRTAPRPDCGLCQALRDYLEAFQQQSDIPVELRVGGDEGELHLPFAAEIQLLRIVQEALANVRKHSGAGRAAVCVMPVDGTVTLTIEDDGQGFDPARKGHGGWPRFGLKTMSERAESVHGTFAVESRRGAGTRVVVTVPREHAGGHDVDDARTAG